MPTLIEAVEQKYNAKHVGFYEIPGRGEPMEVFWQAEVPEEFKDDPRYDNYFGIIVRYAMEPEDGERDSAWITGAKSIRDAKYNAIQLKDGSFIVSRYRHDYVTGPDGEMLDGGISYLRCNPAFPPTHYMRVVDGVEVFKKIPKRHK